MRVGEMKDIKREEGDLGGIGGGRRVEEGLGRK
jgi:hypothetical protein